MKVFSVCLGMLSLAKLCNFQCFDEKSHFCIALISFLIGITRLERWERANRFGLNPPKIVRDIAEKNKEDERYVEWWGG